MTSRSIYLLAADAVLVAHATFVAFVVIGLLLVVAGKLLSWSWVRNPWFRLAHGVAIGVVVLQSWAGAMCPLTTWEMALRQRAGEATQTGSFIVYWLAKLLYYRAPDWVFMLCYTLFGALVAACWLWVRPRPFTAPWDGRPR